MKAPWKPKGPPEATSACQAEQPPSTKPELVHSCAFLPMEPLIKRREVVFYIGQPYLSAHVCHKNAN